MTSVISVIVPAYNAEKTIEKCLGSIASQSYKNLEIIVVNDGSKDSTEKIVHDLALKDTRIKLISVPNGGVSFARNNGLEHVTGDYVTFVDADDTIELNMYQHLMDLFVKYNVDIAHCSYNTVALDGKVVPVGNMGKEILQSTDEAVDSLISGRYFIGGICNKLYRSEVVKNIRLERNIKFNEDVLFNFNAFRKAKASVYSDKPLYNYYQYETSATHTANGLKSSCDIANVSKLIYDESIGKSYEQSAKRRLAMTRLGQFGTYSMNKKSVEKVARKEIKNEVKGYLNDGLYGRSERIKYFLYSFCPSIYKFAYRFYDKVRVKKLDPEQ